MNNVSFLMRADEASRLMTILEKSGTPITNLSDHNVVVEWHGTLEDLIQELTEGIRSSEKVYVEEVGIFYRQGIGWYGQGMYFGPHTLIAKRCEEISNTQMTSITS